MEETKNNPQYQSLKDKLDICLEFMKSVKSEETANNLLAYTQDCLKTSKFKLNPQDKLNIEFKNSLEKHISMEKEAWITSLWLRCR